MKGALATASRAFLRGPDESP